MLKQACGAQAVEQRHADVEDHDVRQQPFAQLDCFLTIAGLTDHFELRVTRQQGDETGARDFMIISEHET
ncbi:hypothetical protein PS685_05009 [Pseudomonas fluorescens]|uniref:Uncharacterized protein n=1 Tax=Pseudomonas fluorescens TaxID=294 RepID=A0A5E6ZVP8_PSEFL|nr:hypothetical protein PS685_05009 [Pseudomonas fluorescens]